MAKLEQSLIAGSDNGKLISENFFRICRPGIFPAPFCAHLAASSPEIIVIGHSRDCTDAKDEFGKWDLLRDRIPNRLAGVQSLAAETEG